MSNTITLPDAVPVMPLPGALLFPHSLLPLYIFENRYREMLAHALSKHRMFCVALVDPHRGSWSAVEDFHHVAGVGLIRACVGRGDGTSNLILQGLHRVRFTRFVQDAPFPIAEIEPLVSIPPEDAMQSESLSAKLFYFYEKFKHHGREFPEKVDRYLADLSDPEMLADLMSATFVSDPLRRQELLEELSITERLQLVLQYLRDEAGDALA